MKVHYIPFRKTDYFSNLICDYIEKKSSLKSFYQEYPDLKGFSSQIKLKQDSFENEKRKVLVNSLLKQNKGIEISDLTAQNINILKNSNTFTITTGHQLNIFTGPLYFLYKIITTINLTKVLKKEFPSYNFVPVYWMATEDHDFEEINYFNFKGKKISWNIESNGAVGRLETTGFDTVYEEFSKLLGDSENATYLKELFKNTYLKHRNLSKATRFLVNELFGMYGLVIIDGDDIELKKQFIPTIKDELLHKTSFKEVTATNTKLEENYNIQVNPREINLFYLNKNLRERIVFKNNNYLINNTNIVFSKSEILNEVSKYPDRFSPNVIMRPLYQETILPNLCYIGGGGELAYWFQLKKYFDTVNVVFPILLLRNSVLLITDKQLTKIGKLHITLPELFLKQEELISKKIKEISDINIDFTHQKEFLQQQFNELKELAKQTDISFLGAVNAQEKKQLNGLSYLEKRLLRAQKRKLSDIVERIKILQDNLFPNQSLEERTRNFSEMYLKLGDQFIPMLIDIMQPLQLEFSIIEY
ncbi:bacillithiol biosynthesis cysteine-adding enzyme BshC [Lutibacter profundi]|uniref:Putative cysteine ligase BshC n=1 Tax=Lutibacter profundi TaxID=1622118 RepID=A0A0X8G5I8_9FLAO|nr:bacillithiol biosynthesis cysteine-adding enzyme BshC [Lutibacter profundi]AMC10425.1 bacillithiol biosynthesis cysteine-adding enzyme BshC [Lutibacter profundi]